jgi:hypothetical protein
VYSLTEHYGRVNYFWHAAARLPAALVPFGVSTVNFIGMSRLVGNMLRDTGMLEERNTKSAGLKCAWQSYGPFCAVDNISELYQVTAAGAVVAGVLQHAHTIDCCTG